MGHGPRGPGTSPTAWGRRRGREQCQESAQLSQGGATVPQSVESLLQFKSHWGYNYDILWQCYNKIIHNHDIFGNSELHINRILPKVQQVHTRAAVLPWEHRLRSRSRAESWSKVQKGCLGDENSWMIGVSTTSFFLPYCTDIIYIYTYVYIYNIWYILILYI